MNHPQGFSFGGAEDIWNEVRQACSGARGMAYQRLDSQGLQWPCPDDTHPGTPVLHVDGWGSSDRAPLLCLDFTATPEQTTPKFPFVLNTGRTLYAFNAGTMTGRGRTRELRPQDRVEIAPTDANEAGLRDGDRVKIASRHGTATLPVHLNPAMRPGELFATFHTPETALNAVTGPYADGITGTPEYKVTAVRIEKA
jgi:formate dehydrogenase major subunit